MSIFNLFSKKEVKQESHIDKFNSQWEDYPTREYNNILVDNFDGEKTPGELGSVLDTRPEHLKLRLRSYDAYLKTDTLRIVLNRILKEVVGSGLKLQAEPIEEVLKLNGISNDLTNFKKSIEANFNLYANSIYSDYSKSNNLHTNATNCFTDSVLGGDSLFILRIDKYGVNAQVISGGLVNSPNDGHSVLKNKKSGNKIVDGIEMDKKGTHIAYYVQETSVLPNEAENKYVRVKARDSKGRVLAKLVYGDKNRINDHRGIPKTTPILESVNKLNRYTEDTISKKQKSAEIVYTFERPDGASEEDPRLPGISNISKHNSNSTNNVSIEDQNTRTAQRVQQTTSNQTFNLPAGTKLVSHQGAEDGNDYSEFSKTIISYMCASLDIPVEVALMSFNSNYSASRAAINAHEFIKTQVRSKFARDFYAVFYKMYLDYMVLTDKVEAPGYLNALKNDDFMVLEAYSNSRWIGQSVAHIDPFKEVRAIELMLKLKLISHEQASEMLNLGNWEDNYKKFQEEGLIPYDEVSEGNNDNNNTNN